MSSGSSRVVAERYSGDSQSGVAAEAAYTVGDTCNEAVGGTWLRPVFDADGEVGFWSWEG